ncbi:hypothetical protein GCM10023187_51650 [Nibrella viscosa]|uniref:AB hydrolase-1 domain-containing protein n=1 Tax=Nibrella viscosa TaxID=1084524 RepID=A0ABP8KYV9_9BACT
MPTVTPDAFQVIRQLYQYDKALPPAVNVVSKQNLPDGTQEKIIFAGQNNTFVPAYLALPKTGTAPFPIVFLVDGITGSKDRWFQDNNWPKGIQVVKALLQSGFAVMALDAVYHGERTAESNYSGVPNPFQYPYTARRMFVQTAVEYRQALDYVSTRADIDSTRIGMLGLSMGGVVSFILTSIDPRIKTAIAGLTPIHQLVEPQVKEQFVVFAPSTFAGSIRANSFLMFMGTRDVYYTMDEARQLYDRIPLKQKEFMEYNTNHTPPVEYIQLVKDWFNTRLK